MRTTADRRKNAAGIAKHHCKLVPSSARDDIPLFEVRPDSRSELSQKFVADPVAIEIVHIPEAVERDEQNGDGTLPFSRLPQFDCKRFFESGPVGQFRDRIPAPLKFQVSAIFHGQPDQQEKADTE